MRFFAALLIFFGVAASYGQTPEVPRNIIFAGMSLSIRDDARREIQKDVDALRQHAGYFGVKVERAKTYFPIIEKIFQQEHLPDDFKYLCLQESALVPDAVSITDARGFWQFKDFTAQEMGLRVDKEVDERMNIVSSSTAAARYLKQNNLMFNNWLLALQAYQMGAGGVKRSVGDQYNGATHMEISSDTYWYVKKFIAHKIAFENSVQGQPMLRVDLYPATNKKISEVALEVSVDEKLLKEYNKWAKKDIIPNDKNYDVVVPGKILSSPISLSQAATPLAQIDKVRDEKMMINGVEAIKARQGETVMALANRAGVRLNKFIEHNDMSTEQQLSAGTFYFLNKKKKSSETPIYKTKTGDNIWSISQQFGVRLKQLIKLNPQVDDGTLVEGTLIRLNATGVLSGTDTEELANEKVELSNETFAWAGKPSDKVVPPITPPSTAIKVVSVDTTKKVVIIPVALPTIKLDTTTQHEVTKGETLYSIAQKYSLHVSDLIATNKLDPTIPLKLGQRIEIKNSSATITSKPMETDSVKTDTKKNNIIIYVVKNSDTLYGIARRFGATIKEIMDWNNKTELKVTQGEKLMIVRNEP